MDDTYDVLVVGGGAAGLSAALTLSRARRSVLVVDAGEPRNTPAGHVHNYLGREGTPPGELLAVGRDEVASYGGQVVAGTVAAATRLGEDDGFEVTLAGGRAVRARRLLVTTGLVDELPDVPGVAERWGRDVLHCPYCHGWEVRDRAIGVLATSPMAVHGALLFRQWSADLTLLVHTSDGPSDSEREQLVARGVRVVEGEVERLEVVGDELTGVRLRSGERVALQAVVVAPFFRARSDLLAGLGLESVPLQMGEHVVGTCVPSQAMGATEVAGVWVAGNVTDLRAQVISSAAAGLETGAAINADLVAEDTARAVEARQAHPHAHGPDAVLDKAFWDSWYDARSAIWSGRPNPQLVAETADLEPGTALDVGSGEGADAVWLAERGWRVTAIDISDTALRRGARHAAEAGPDAVARITWLQGDLSADPAPAAPYDLVTAQFFHLPTARPEELHRRLAAAVAPGGLLLVVGHHPDDVHAGVGRWSAHDALFTPERVVAVLDPEHWIVLTAEVRPRDVTGDDGVVRTVQDVVVAARRRG